MVFLRVSIEVYIIMTKPGTGFFIFLCHFNPLDFKCELVIQNSFTGVAHLLNCNKICLLT